MKTNRTSAAKRKLAGYTLVELMLALSIFAFSSTAVSSLMFATYNTNRHVKGMVNASDSAEIVLRRIFELGRSSAYFEDTGGNAIPVGGSKTSVSIETPPDTYNPNLNYIYTYHQQTVNGVQQLWEKIQPDVSGVVQTPTQDCVIVSNINSFQVTRLDSGTSGTLQQYGVNIVLNATPVPISRSVVITTRNLSN